MTNDTIDKDARVTLAAVARLLHHAAVRTWARAEAEGSGSYLHLLGLGIHIAYCQTVAMLPVGAHLEGHPPAQGDVAKLLRAAEDLTRRVPVPAQTPGISPLVAAICDLVREATP